METSALAFTYYLDTPLTSQIMASSSPSSDAHSSEQAHNPKRIHDFLDSQEYFGTF